MPDRSTIERFLSCDRIAFVGASRYPKSFANAVLRHFKASGHTVVPVNALAEGGTIEGERCYARLADVPGVIDAAYVIVPRDQMKQVVDDAIARGIRMVWLHRGAGQAAPPAEAVNAALDAGVELVDGACALMFDEPVTGIHRLHRLLIRHRFAA